MNENKIRFADNFFNIKLYLQGLKRLKVTGLVALVCMSLFSVFTIISQNLGRSSIEYIQAYSGIYSMMTVVAIIIVPLMVLILFHYLTRRNGSDFYHSLAQKRRSVYFSFVAAVITWSIIIIVVFTLVTTIAYMLVSKLCILNTTNILMYSFNILISCILVAAVFTLGCSITGTVFSNLVASSCILVLPRILITAFSYLIASESLILSTNNMPLLTRYTCNLPVTILFDSKLVINHDISNTLSSLGFSSLYTFILAIIYLMIGCIMYVKRPSETAGKAASSTKIQYCLRMMLGYLVTLIIVSYLYSRFVNGRGYSGQYIFVGIIIFLIAVLLMFLYELITTRTLKSACKTLLHSPILLVMDVVTIGILLLINSYTLNNVPVDSSVDYIRIDVDNVADIRDFTNNFTAQYTLMNDQNTIDYTDYWTNNGYYYDGAGLDYLFGRLSDIELTDKDAIKVATAALKEYCSLIKEDPQAAEYPYYYDEASDKDIYYAYQFAITYGTGHSELTRYVRLKASDAELIINALLDSTESQDILHTLPEYNEPGTYVMHSTLSDKELEDIYNSFREEIKDVSMTDYLNTMLYSHTATTLELYDYEDSILSSTQLYLTSATPNTLSMYMRYYNEHNKNSFDEKLLTVLNDTEAYHAYMTAYIYDYAEGKAHYATDRHSSSSERALLVSANTLSDAMAIEIPENLEEKFNPETHYLCFINIDLFELFKEYASELQTEVITMEDYMGSSGFYFLLNKDYDINKLFDEFSDSSETVNIFVP